MLYPSINELRESVDSKYTLVVLAAKRARDIIDEKPMLVDIETEKPVSIAAAEIHAGLITYNRIDIDEDEGEYTDAYHEKDERSGDIEE